MDGTTCDVEFEHSSVMLQAPSCSPGPDSCNDSCYDSDGSPRPSRRNSRTQQLESQHHDVSRTVSDTLAAEHTDSDETRSANGSHDGKVTYVTESQSPDPSEKLFSEPEYSAKIQFALKLGYTEDHLKAALEKIGIGAGQNELLNELIKIGSSDSGNSYEERENASQPFSLESRAHTDDPLDLHILSHYPAGQADDNLRPIVIDGSNVAMSHGGKDVFSCLGIKLAVDWFQQRGHKDIVVFVPQWRKESHNHIKDQEILDELEHEQILVYTPSRRIAGKRVICYDDRYILKLAVENGGIVVSNDNYRDLINEKPEYKRVVEERLLMYSFVNDRFMPPDDPLGRKGPSLENFLRKNLPIPECRPSVCPYGRKCTYGNKCKYFHPERGFHPHKPVTEQLAEKAKANMARHKERLGELSGHNMAQGKMKLHATVSDGVMVMRKKDLARKSSITANTKKMSVCRTKSLASDSIQTKEAKRELSSEGPVYNTMQHTPSFSTMSFSEGAGIQGSDFEAPEHTIEHGNSLGDIMHGVRTAPTGASLHQLQLPTHWSLPAVHHSLHTSYSDPTLIAQSASFMDGHLALAKKLSDEGKRTDRQSKSPTKNKQLANCSESIQQNSRKPKQHQLQQDQPQHTHKKLNRQLSLSGSADPRLQPRPFSRFPGHEPGTHQQSSEQSLWSFSGGPGSHPATEHPVLRNQNGHQYLTRHASHGGLAPTMQTQKYHPNHVPISRMASAPVTYQNTVSKQGKPVPAMHRQNSTSDPQIHSFSEKQEVQYSDRAALFYTRHPNAGMHPPGGSEKYITLNGQVFCFGSNPEGSEGLELLPQSCPRGERVRVEVEPELHANLTSPPGITAAQPSSKSDIADVGPTVAPGKSILMQQMESAQKQQQHDSQQKTDPGLPASAFYRDHGTIETTPSPAQWHVYMALSALFPPELVQQVIMKHPQETDRKVLCEYLLALCKEKSK